MHRSHNGTRPITLLILVVAVLASAAAAAGPTAVELTRDGDPSTWPTTDYRWWDVANNVFEAAYQAAYTYDQADVRLTYAGGPGATFAGHLSATNLKPNFAYQVKLVGKPTGIWDENGDDQANENIGYAGRWWRAQPSPANATDADYEAHKDDPAYIYEGYLLFDYFVTDRFGDAEVDLALDSSFHVLATDSQGSPGVCDGPFRWRTVVGSAADAAYAADVGPTDVGVYATWESTRPCAGELVLPDGVYDCRLVLTEESFHQTGAGSGTWAGAMRHDGIDFTISAAPTVDAHDYVDIGNPASEAGHAMLGWGPVEPDANGGTWGGIGGEIPPGRCRTVWSPAENAPVEPWSSLELDFGVSDTAAKCLKFRYLDGGSDDSFVLEIDGATVLTVAAPPTTETWRWAAVDVTGITGSHTVTFRATAPAGSYYDPYGQLAIDRIHVGAQITPVPANDSPDRVDVIRCGGVKRVDFRYSADCATPPIRGYSVRVRCPEGEDRLAFDAGDFAVNIVPEGLSASDVFWQVHRAPGAAAANDWTIDYAILGEAAALVGGIPDDVDLFAIDFHAGPAEGTGNVIIEEVVVGLIDGGQPPAVGGNSTTIALDCTAPDAVTGLTAFPGRDKIQVGWDPFGEPGCVLEVWRGLWTLAPPDTSVSAYPEYDDHVAPEDLQPPWPLDHGDLAPSGMWDLVRILPADRDSIVDFPNPPDGLRRGIYHYAVFAVDAAGNPGARPDAPARSTSYLLGDLPSRDGTLPADGAIAINPEINRLALCYGAADGATAYDPFCDVGPTHDMSAMGIPTTDDLIDFEDLMVFAINFNVELGKSSAAQGGPVAALTWTRIDETTWGLFLREPCADLRGLRLRADAPADAVGPVAAGSLIVAQDGPCFVANIDGRGLDAGLARLGAGIAGRGELLRVAAEPGLDLSNVMIDARNSANEKVVCDLDQTTGVEPVPTAFALSENYPNPFNPSTTIDFALPRPERVRLAVYDVDGRLVAALLDAPLPAGRHSATWTGRTDRGEIAASGIYFVRIEAGSFTGTRKMTLLK